MEGKEEASARLSIFKEDKEEDTGSHVCSCCKASSAAPRFRPFLSSRSSRSRRIP